MLFSFLELLMTFGLVNMLNDKNGASHSTPFGWVKDMLSFVSSIAGSTKAKGREPKTGLGQIFNYKLGCYEDVHVIMYTDAHTHIYSWKLGPGFVLLAKVCLCLLLLIQD